MSADWTLCSRPMVVCRAFWELCFLCCLNWSLSRVRIVCFVALVPWRIHHLVELHRLRRLMEKCLLGCLSCPLFPCYPPSHFSCDHAVSAPCQRRHSLRSLPTMPRPLHDLSIASRRDALASPQKKAYTAPRATHQTTSQRIQTHPIPLSQPLPHARSSSCDPADSSSPSAFPAAASAHPPSRTPAPRHRRRRPSLATRQSHPRPNRRRNQS